jgi:predicted small lipoprotein YifL
MMLRRIFLVACAAVLLASCGARGALEPPPGYEKAKDDSFVLDPLVKQDKGN